MKFLKEEHESISQLLQENGLKETEFSFRKKRGQLHIEINGRKDTFCFYRKTETKLTPQMKFEDETNYYLGLKKEIVVNTWEEVLGAVENWLND